MNARNKQNADWLKKKHSHPEWKESSSKSSSKYQSHKIVSGMINVPRQSRRGA
ncbi:hypothetical protein [Enterocloster alcoholdehydrogenati]|uniref:Uncharacterized protein n=1 Tax=Enterocloster alcoholdehydrogenati TaxID=2547410 RepID=A0ABQ0AZC5_9FIRM